MKKSDCILAIELATTFMEEETPNYKDFKLVGVENDLRKITEDGPVTWRLTFKPKRLIPQTNNVEIGSGGEIFVEVDVEKKSAKISAYGE